MICALGWHRWKGGVCSGCGKTRTCAFERHYWSGGRCEVCGSRRMGVAQIVTLIDKIVRKRFDKKHPEWIAELTEVGPIAIPYILKEMLEMARSEADVISPPFLDLRRALSEMGEKGSALLDAAVRDFSEAEGGRAGGDPDRRERVRKVADEIRDKWREQSEQSTD